MSRIRKNIQDAKSFGSIDLSEDKPISTDMHTSPTNTKSSDKLRKARILDKVYELACEHNYNEIAITNQKRGMYCTQEALKNLA